jgi:hypothetical protein
MFKEFATILVKHRLHPQLNVCSLGWVIDSNTVRSVTCVPLSFPEPANRWERTSHRNLFYPLERPSGTGSSLWSGPAVRTGGRQEPVPAVQPIDCCKAVLGTAVLQQASLLLQLNIQLTTAQALLPAAWPLMPHHFLQCVSTVRCCISSQWQHTTSSKKALLNFTMTGAEI